MVRDFVNSRVSSGQGILRTGAIFFVAGACGWFVMQMEILGARLLAPYFGSAIYVVMGSVIGVFLLSLSCGYMLGGWLSRRPSSKRILAICVAAAGAWLCVLPLIHEPVCNWVFQTGLGEEWGSLLAAFALFVVPTVLLGTVSPTVVRWMTRRAGDSGLNAGLVFAFSTVASFGGCVVTAFYFVRFSMERTILASGALLLILGGAILMQATLGRSAAAQQEEA
ncbi:MAG: fused MFS/spermidine synthase [Planctomycetota bacterium]|jgi:MFS family permease